MALEIEAKIYIGDLEMFQERLIAAGAMCVKDRYHERNQLYNSPYQNFQAERTILRLRQDHHAKITLKKPSTQEEKGVRVRHEFETTVGEGETMDAILRGLGYEHGLFYEKYRTVYRIPDLDTAEIVVDELPFGNFVEIEGPADVIEAIVDRLALSDSHRIQTNYAGILSAIVRTQSLDFEHATFANFEHVMVDVTLFETL